MIRYMYRDSDLTVAKYVDKVAKENNANLAVKKFIRFETGEGIEKKDGWKLSESSPKDADEL